MNKHCLLSFLLWITLWGCDSGVDFELADPPQKVEVLSGNNQLGFPGYELSDAIEIKIIPNKLEDLEKYWIELDGDFSSAQSNLQVVDNEIHISVIWSLSQYYYYSEPELKIHLFGCERKKKWWLLDPIKTIIINAKYKGRWDLVFENPDKNILRSGEFYDLHFVDDMNGIVVGSYNTGYLKTNDGGDHWEFDNVLPSDVYQLHFADPLNGIAIETNNYCYFTSDGGKSFQSREWTVPIVGHLASADYLMLNINEIISVGKNGKLVKSVDGGKSWTTYEELLIKSWFYSLFSSNGIDCYACGELGKIVKSSNSGDTWIQQYVETNYDLKEIWFLDKDFGFAGGEQGCLVRTTDGGENWSVIQSKIKSTIIGVYFINKNTGYIASESGEIARSDDGGLTWELIKFEGHSELEIYRLNKVYFKMPYLFGVEDSNVYKCILGDD